MKKNLCDSPKNYSHSYILDLGQSKPGQSKLCVSTYNNDSDVSNISDHKQWRAVKRKLPDHAKKTIFYCGSREMFLRTNLKYIRTFVWFVINLMSGFTTDVLGFQEKKK